MGKITLAVCADKAALKEAVQTMLGTNDTIISTVVGSTATQTQQAVKKLAEHQKKIIRFIARNLA